MSDPRTTASTRHDRGTAASAGTATGLSAFASFVGLCCAGPWAVALFGVPGAIVLARWHPLRPWLLVVAAGLLVWAFWRVYRPKPQCPDGSCPARTTRRLKLFLWCASAVLVIAVFAEQLQFLLIDPTPEGLRK